MLNTLRNRLLASYLTIILVTIGFIGLALLIFLRARPLPTDEVVRDLAATLIDVRVTEIWQIDSTLDLENWNPGDGNPLSIRSAFVSISAYLEDQAAARDMRAMIVSDRGVVAFDSAHTYAERDQVKEFKREPLYQAARPGIINNNVYQGRFKDPDGTEWLFVAQPLNPFLSFFENTVVPAWSIQLQGENSTLQLNLPAQIGEELPRIQFGRNNDNAQQPLQNFFVVVAQPPPTPTLREVFRLFGNTFFEPLLYAGLLGLGVALILAALIARSVARPLQHISRAAGRIAEGDFSQRAPVKGPHEVRTLAKSFNGMVQQVNTTQEAQRDFLANVSHDLRTPLTSIQGFSQAIVDGIASNPASAQRAAQIIHDEAARMHRMVEDLLDIARIEAGRADMLRNAVQVGDILRAITDSLSVKAQDKQIHLSVDIPEQLPRIAGDGDRLAQVFTNLIDNAIKHTPAQGRIAVSAQTTDRQIAVTIADTGAGIPAEDLPRIFERFYQVDKSRQRQRRSGVGLGLAITKQIVEAHGGTLHVASQEGTGTTFTVWLPFLAPEASTLVMRHSA